MPDKHIISHQSILRLVAYMIEDAKQEMVTRDPRSLQFQNAEFFLKAVGGRLSWWLSGTDLDVDAARESLREYATTGYKKHLGHRSLKKNGVSVDSGYSFLLYAANNLLTKSAGTATITTLLKKTAAGSQPERTHGGHTATKDFLFGGFLRLFKRRGVSRNYSDYSLAELGGEAYGLAGCRAAGLRTRSTSAIFFCRRKKGGKTTNPMRGGCYE